MSIPYFEKSFLIAGIYRMIIFVHPPTAFFMTVVKALSNVFGNSLVVCIMCIVD